MGASQTLVWLICCLVIVLGLVAMVMILVVRRARRARRVGGPAIPSWPDFAVVDSGDEIHFVPLEEDGHVLASGQCPCHPRRTANRRRSGRRVVYVDHQSLRRASA